MILLAENFDFFMQDFPKRENSTSGALPFLLGGGLPQTKRYSPDDCALQSRPFHGHYLGMAQTLQ